MKSWREKKTYREVVSLITEEIAKGGGSPPLKGGSKDSTTTRLEGEEGNNGQNYVAGKYGDHDALRRGERKERESSELLPKEPLRGTGRVPLARE